uniref:RNA-directed DNA polymerase, eukaryota n=1 Tax=Tanacetum cinerariifolium TaxID=118510 RepID=A0A699H7K3_TANCI|nr:RNA-directed DNA polymerase, eukaryota [Tanacetum cinerariifolium]
MEVKYLWGNYAFDHIVSEALGNSGGILYAWDSNVFHKKHHIISDNFVACTEIRKWVADYKCKQKGCTRDVTDKLRDIDKLLDQGEVTDDILLSRLDLMKQLHDLKSSDNRDLFQKAKVRINFQFPNKLNQEQVSDLESPVPNDEIRNAVWGCGENKSPRPDGFTFEFFRKFWPVVGPDFCTAVQWFFKHGYFASGCNSSFVTLIPKTADLKMTTFLLNRQILDGPFIVNEILARCKYKNQHAMIFKVDLAKAYDYIRWDYLDDVLNAFGFGHKWRSWIQGFQIDDSLSISHLFYADDAIFIGDWSNENLNGILNTLNCFALLSGMSINLNKSQILGLGIRDVIVFEAAKVLGCEDETVNKLSKRLSKWKLKTLSIGGRLTLLKSVLGSTPIYNMSIFKVPKSVLSKMENMRRNFFHGIQEGEKKIAWVKWHTVLANKKFGAIHGSDSSPLSAAYPSIWGSIIKEFNSLKDQGVDIFSHCKNRIGNGIHTPFWKDFWIGDQRLSGLFPRLFALESLKDITVAEKLQSSVVASWVCDLNGDGTFRVKDVRNVLDECFLPKADVSTRWVKFVPIKINIFAWKVVLDRLPTRVNLVNKNVAMESVLCPLCVADLEDTSHLLFNCSLARDVTRLVCRWWNLGVHSFSSYANWLDWFKYFRIGSKLKVILEGTFYVTWWSLWNIRNQTLFGSKKPRKESIFDDIVLRVFNWCSSRENSETKEEDVNEDESDHNNEQYTFEVDDDDGQFDDLN